MSTTLREQLASPNPEERRLAANALATDASDHAPELLAQALGDENWRVRKEAAQSAVAMPKRADVLRGLLRALDDRENVGLRNAAVEALIAIGPDAIPTAIEGLSSLDADGRKLAVEVLGGVPDVRSTHALVGALRDGDVNVRQAAAEALGASALAGEDARAAAVAALREVLAKGEPLMKLAALGALSRLDVSLEWAQLAPLLKQPMLRGAALAMCARCSDPACGEALVPLVLDGSTALARAALVALADWVRLAMPQAIPVDRVAARLQAMSAGPRVRELAEGDAQVHGAALMVLALLGDAEAAPAIVRGLLDPVVARSAEAAVTLLGAAALPALLAVGEREPPSRHAALLNVVPTLTARLDDRALAVVRATLSHEADDVVSAAAQVLGALGEGADIDRLATVAAQASGRAKSSATFAIEALAERYPEDARAAFERFAEDPLRTLAGCILLGALHGALAGALPYLKRALGAGDAPTRRAAIEALAATGGDDARTTVATALADEDRDVQLAAVRALGQLRHGDALSTLIGSQADAEIVATAVSALCDADATRARDVCTSLVQRADPAIASAAVLALGRLEDRAAAEVGLLRALDHGSEEVVKLALTELGREPSRVVRRIGQALDHPSWEIRRVAAEILGVEGTDEARALLRARLERETDATVREAIMMAQAAPGFLELPGSREPT